jgi:hypothetical protein
MGCDHGRKVPVKEPREDDERISALIEGQVTGRQRDEMLARLAASDDDYEVFTDTAAVLQALEDEDARADRTGETPVISLPDDKHDQENPVPEMVIAALSEQGGVIPLRPPARGPRLPVRWLALAASVVGVVVISTLALPRRGSPGHEPRQLALGVDSLPKGWVSPTQSGGRGPAGSTTDDALAVYAGAMLVDISVAARAGDTARTRELAKVLSRRADPGASAAAPLERIAANPGAPTDLLLALVDEATDRLLATQLERRPLELGAWIEVARLAARRRDTRDEAFFRDPATDGMLGRAERVAGDDDAARAAVKSVREALPAGGPPQWDSLEQDLTPLLRELTN